MLQSIRLNSVEPLVERVIHLFFAFKNEIRHNNHNVGVVAIHPTNHTPLRLPKLGAEGDPCVWIVVYYDSVLMNVKPFN